jgi:hypothetical protein
VDLDSPGYHEDQRSFPTLTLGWKKQRHLDSQFDQPNKSNILTKAAINGIQAKVESKIIDFGLQFQVSYSTSPQESTKSIKPSTLHHSKVALEKHTKYTVL